MLSCPRLCCLEYPSILGWITKEELEQQMKKINVSNCSDSNRLDQVNGLISFSKLLLQRKMLAQWKILQRTIV